MSLEEMEAAIIDIIEKDSHISQKIMAKSLNVSEKTISIYIKKIPNIRFVGKGKNGHWVVEYDTEQKESNGI